MITAVDTNVLLDVFGADPKFGEASRRALGRCVNEGRLVASDIVWAEIAGAFPTPDEARSAMERLGVTYGAPGADSALAAGAAWRAYRRGGGPRTRVIADFLVGAYARIEADRLLTRDRGFYRKYFRDLAVVDPSVG